MNPFEMVIGIVLLGTIGKLALPLAQGLGSRLGRGTPAVDPTQLHTVQRVLSATEERLGSAEERIAQLDEKLAFVERLVARPAQQAELPAPPPPLSGDRP